MAIYHCQVKIIGRSSGRSAIASAAYRAGEKLRSEETGRTFDFTYKHGVQHSEIILPTNAPEAFNDRATLWNSVQAIEKAKDSQLAREFEVALPKEWSLDQQKDYVREWVKDTFVAKGMCADWAIHDKGDGNPHAHIMCTMRSLDEQGQWLAKTKKVYQLDEEGNKVPLIDKATGQQKVDSQNRKQWVTRKEDVNDWNKPTNVDMWRESWSVHCNKYLEPEKQIDHRSYEEQGKDIIPTIHEGYVARQIEARGGVSELCEQNRQIKEQNRLIEQAAAYLKEQLEKIKTEIERIKGFFIVEIPQEVQEGNKTKRNSTDSQTGGSEGQPGDLGSVNYDEWDDSNPHKQKVAEEIQHYHKMMNKIKHADDKINSLSVSLKVEQSRLPKLRREVEVVKNNLEAYKASLEYKLSSLGSKVGLEDTKLKTLHNELKKAEKAVNDCNSDISSAKNEIDQLKKLKKEGPELKERLEKSIEFKIEKGLKWESEDHSLAAQMKRARERADEWNREHHQKRSRSISVDR